MMNGSSEVPVNAPNKTKIKTNPSVMIKLGLVIRLIDKQPL